MSKFRHPSTGRYNRLNAFATVQPVHHNPGIARKADVSRDGGAPKNLAPVALHGGMSRQQAIMAGLGGLGHPSSVNRAGGQPVANRAAAPMAHTYGSVPKTCPAAPVHPAMAHLGIKSSDLHALGAKILAEGTMLVTPRSKK